MWGIVNEPTAIETLERRLFEDGITATITACGIFIDATLDYLGATPDGLIGDDGIVEIKCPESAKDCHPDDAVRLQTTVIIRYFDKQDPSKMNSKHVYYYRVQGQLHVTQREYCYFAVWTPLGIKYVKVLRDDEFWTNRMEPYLSRFYENCLLPEIIDSRHNRNMPIREPGYILEARRLRNEASKATNDKRKIRETRKSTAREAETQSQQTEENLLVLGDGKDVARRLKPRVISNIRVDNLKITLKKEIPTDNSSWIIANKSTPMAQRGSPLKLRKIDTDNESSWVISSADERVVSKVPQVLPNHNVH